MTREKKMIDDEIFKALVARVAELEQWRRNIMNGLAASSKAHVQTPFRLTEFLLSADTERCGSVTTDGEHSFDCWKELGHSGQHRESKYGISWDTQKKKKKKKRKKKMENVAVAAPPPNEQAKKELRQAMADQCLGSQTRTPEEHDRVVWGVRGVKP